MFTLDTNAIIYYLGGEDTVVVTLQEIFGRREPVYVSTVSQAELLSFRGLTSEDEQLIDDLMATVALIPVDSQVARLGAAIRRAHGLPLPDSLIAATALFTGSTLVTRNIRDFRKVNALELRAI